jgi:hypothetical protein
LSHILFVFGELDTWAWYENEYQGIAPVDIFAPRESEITNSQKICDGKDHTATLHSKSRVGD